MAKSDFQNPGLSLAEIENLVAQLRFQKDTYAAADTPQKTQIDQAITQAGQAATSWNGRGFGWSERVGAFETYYQEITNVARATNVATITVGDTSNLNVGCRVRITGVTVSGFDDDDAFVTAVGSSTTFTYANTGSNVTSVADATGTSSCHGYTLRTTNSNEFQDITAPRAVYIPENDRFGKIDKRDYDSWIALYAIGGSNQPDNYCIWEEISSTYSAGLMMGMTPIPDAEYTIRIPYLRRHSKITSDGSTDTALIVPSEHKVNVYVHAAVFLLQHQQTNPADLSQCPQFMQAIEQMAASDPARWYDSGRFGHFPPDRRVHFIDGGTYVNRGNLSI